MKQPGTFIGALAAFGLTAGLALALNNLPQSNDLEVDVDSPRAFVVEGTRKPLPRITSGPPELVNRVEIGDLPADSSGGIHLRTWRVDYAHRWEREVTLPIVSGPLVKEGANVCGFSLRVGAGIFANDEAIESAVHNELRQRFPIDEEISGIKVKLPALVKTNLDIALRKDEAQISIGIRLEDGSTIDASTKVRLISRNGAPAIERMGGVKVDWEGPSFDDVVKQASEKGAEGGGLLGGLLGLVFFGPAGALVGGVGGAGVGSSMGEDEARDEAPKKAAERIATEIDKALVKLTLGMAGLTKHFAPLSARPNDTVALSLERDPAVSPTGIVVPLCTKLKIGGIKRDAAIQGPANVNSSNVHALQVGTVDRSSDLELSADANAINQALYFLWQTGTLRELGQSSAILDALPESIRSLAFDVTGFDPGLPPTVVSTRNKNNELTIVLADIALGAWERRRVVGHAITMVGIDRKEQIELSANFQHMSVNCVEPMAAFHFKLTPCLSDLLPTVREMVQEKPLVRRMPGGDLLGKLPEMAFAGLKVDLSDLRVNTSASPPSIRFRVETKIRTGVAP